MREVSAAEAWLRKYPERTVLAVTTDQAGKPNMIALGWNMPVSGDPPMVAIAVGHHKYSHQLLQEGGEFVLAFPSLDMEDSVMYCGTHSGRDVDKFKETGLTPIKAKCVQPPLIHEAVVNMECRVVGELVAGDHTIFVGEIMTAYLADQSRPVLFNMGPDEDGKRVFAGF